MALTTRSNLVIPEILADAVQGQFEGMRALYGTGAAVVNDSLPAGARGGDTIRVPYFGTLGELDDLTAEGAAAVPTALAMSSEQATVQHSAKAVEITAWAQLAAAYADPYAEAARQFRIMAERRADKALLDAATASLPGSQIVDVYNSTVPKVLGWDTMVDAKLAWGDEQGDIAALVVHSKVLGDLMKQKDTTGRPLFVDAADGALPRFAGVPIIVSDRATKSADSPAKYESLLVKKGALVLWYAKTPSVDADKDITRDTEVLAMHVYWVAHRYGRTPGGTRPGVVKIVTN